MISLYIQREECKFAQTICFIQSHFNFIFIRSRYNIKPKIIISAVGETVCRASVVVVIFRDVVVEVFKVAQNVLHLEIKRHVVA